MGSDRYSAAELSWMPSLMHPKIQCEWTGLETQLNRYINLIAASQRIPIFLVLLDWQAVSIGDSQSNSFQRILFGWLQRDSQLKEQFQRKKRSRIFAALNHADVFLEALSEALDANLGPVCRDRRHTLSNHSAIMCAWLESSTIDDIANLSSRWHRLLRRIQNAKPDSPQAVAKNMPNEQLDHGAELAWTLIQSHKLGATFRRTYSEHFGAIDQSSEGSSWAV